MREENQGLMDTPWRRSTNRTRDTLASMPHFECGAFNHSATSPSFIDGPFVQFLR